MQLNLRNARTWDDVVAMVDTAVRQARPGEWILGRGWHQEKWESTPPGAVEGLPVHTSLSAVSPMHPVLLRHASGHMVFANQKAMDLCGLSSETPDPSGGTVVRDSEGNPTGALREAAAGQPAAASAEVERAVQKASQVQQAM